MRSHPRQILLDLGVPQAVATMSIPYVWFLPGAVDPDAQGVMEIVKAIQRGLRKLGFPVMVSGVMDREFAAAMDVMFHPRGAWTSTTWMVILDRVRKDLRAGKRYRSSASAMSGLGDYHRGYGPAPGWMVGLPPGPLGLGDFVLSSGIAKPKDLQTLGQHQGLQRAINAGLRKLGKKTIAEDGDIGTGTVAGAAAVGFPFASPSALAGAAANTAIAIALKFGVQPDFTADPAKARSSALVAGVMPLVADTPLTERLKQSLDQFPGGKFLPFIALGVGVAYVAVKARGKRKAN